MVEERMLGPFFSAGPASRSNLYRAVAWGVSFKLRF